MPLHRQQSNITECQLDSLWLDVVVLKISTPEVMTECEEKWVCVTSVAHTDVAVHACAPAGSSRSYDRSPWWIREVETRRSSPRLLSWGLTQSDSFDISPKRSGEAVAAALQTRHLLPRCRHRSGPLSASPLPPHRGWCCCSRHLTLLVSLLQNTTENLLIEFIFSVAEPCHDAG